MNDIQILLEVHGGNFELWTEEKYGATYYHVGIEGYIGFERIEDFIGLYEFFLEKLHEYLTENNYAKREVSGWKRIYKKRAIEICYESGCYWVFLDGYESTDIWDTYYYLKDVIDQLKEVEISQ
ncbi:hypothetical protein [Siminovitchia fordii]|uniref:Uncharacterized protein n=1 Tax=Siminovitchia fordii TaxID=254759 RepID=A0ABQ4K9Y4_9BACI|nr:hypothetical protein [Siminovitchia fordii]GIN22527.1 hypothetical protein J1TS3_36610 [Siminovitchia fordii]